MKKLLSKTRYLLAFVSLVLLGTNAVKAEEKTIQWKVPSTEPTGGEQFEVKSGDQTAIKVAFGNISEGWTSSGNTTIKITVGGVEYDFGKSYLTTDDTSGKDDNTNLAVDGSSPFNYIGFVPEYDGTLVVAIQNAGNTKNLKVRENGETMTGEFKLISNNGSDENATSWENGNPLNTSAAFNGAVSFSVKKGSEYTVSLGGSKARWSGFLFTYDDNPAAQTQAATPKISVSSFNFATKNYSMTITAADADEIWYSIDDATEVKYDGAVTLTGAEKKIVAYAKAAGLEDSEKATEELSLATYDASKKYIAWVYVEGYGVASYAFETDPLVEALQEDYNVVAVNYTDTTTPSEDLANADLIVCSEAMSGNTTMSNGMKNLVGQAPMLSLKFFNYTSGRWSWGTPANPSTTTLGFTPQSTSYKVLSGVTYEEDGTIKLATQSFNDGSQKNVVQTVNFSAAPEDNVIMGTVGGVETAAAMHASNEQRYFGLGLSSDCWQYYTENAMTIVKNAADMLIAGEDLTEVVPSSVTATITEAKYATFYAEFDATIPENVIAYGATLNEEKTAIVLTAIEGNVIPAETAVILYSEAAGEYTFTEAEEAATEAVSSILTGTAIETSISENDYVLGNGNSGVGFYHLASGYKLGANQAYLTLPSEARVAFIGFGDNTVTAIDAVATPVSAGKAYNLNGVQAAPNAKGVVIMDGKKVVLK